MSLAPILTDEQAEGVVVLTLNRPHVRNAIDTDAMHALARVSADLAAQPPRVVIVTGAGGTFCSGGDLADLHTRTGADDARAMNAVMGSALATLEALPCPTIAAIDGYALGGGTEIALACDWRVMSEDARFGMVHAARGLIPGWGGAARLLARVGYARALDVLVSGQVYTAAEALALGLCERVAPPGGALPAALGWAARVAHLPADAVHAAKAVLRAGAAGAAETAAALERDRFAALWAGPAHAASLAEYRAAQEAKRRG
jgi:enoyl-CoA hydratase